MLNIKPIKLLYGTHEDTVTTGQGCFMNVVAYLNGEAQITDQSPCVCVTVRPIAIFLNDFLKDDERAQLIPFIERAMGSATTDEEELHRRVTLVVQLAHKMAETAETAERASAAIATDYARAASVASDASRAYACDAAAYATRSANDAAYADAAAFAADAAAYATRSANDAAVYAADATDAYAPYATRCAAYTVNRSVIIATCMQFLDEALPAAAPVSDEVIARAARLVEMA